jgi:hypothetical protein
LLLAYSIGPPTPAVDPDTLDIAEWGIRLQTPIALDDLSQVLYSMPAPMACVVASTLMPYTSQLIWEILKAGLRGDQAALAALGAAPPDAGCDDTPAKAEPAPAEPSVADAVPATRGKPRGKVVQKVIAELRRP